MCKCPEGTLFKTIALTVTVFGIAFQTISLVAPFWTSVAQADDTDWNLGLWLNCSDLSCAAIGDTPGWMQSARAFKVMSLMSGFACLVCISVFTYRPTEAIKNHKWPTIIITLLPFITAVLEQISSGVFIRAVTWDEAMPSAQGHLSWAIGFSILAVVMYSAVCVFLFIDLVRKFYGDPVKKTKLSKI